MVLRSLGIDPDEVLRAIREAESGMIEIRKQLNRIEDAQKEILKHTKKEHEQ